MSYFREAYEGTPPWDVGRPQPEYVRLEEAGEIKGRVLDIGCGTGENALHMASRGHETWGIDFVPRAIEKARAKAAERGLEVTFRVFDATRLAELGETFDTVICSGLFHSLSDEGREELGAGLRVTVRPGGKYFILAFSDLEPGDWGPRRVRRDEFGEFFREDDGWHIDYVRATYFADNHDEQGAHAWLASITRRP